MFLCLLVLLSIAFAQEICTTTNVGLQGGVDDFGKMAPQKVIYMNIVGPSHHYESNMALGFTMLNAIIRQKYPTSTAQYMVCSRGNCAMDFSPFTQIWVTDLSSEFDLNANQLQTYKNIATWYQSKDRPPLIADGRLLSSLWPSPVNGGCCSQYGYTYPGNTRPNPRLMENYFVSLALRGGGLMLGTDHNAFTDGINEVMKNCGFAEFYGNYYTQPLIMEIDEKSTVMNFPQDASENIPGWTTPVRKFLWDDSSTAYSPVSEQANGLVLYPIGWHGTGELAPGISTTIRGTVGFLIEIAQPSCGAQFQQGTNVFLQARVVKSGTPPYAWEWSSSVDGSLGKTISLNAALSPGRHVLTVRVKDSQRFVATAWVTVTMVYNSGAAECIIFSRNETEVIEYYPLQRKDGVSAQSYYSYGSPRAARANTGDALEDKIALSLNAALYNDNRGTLSLIFVTSANPLVTNAKLTISMDQGRKVDGRLDPVTVTLRDDPGDIGFVWNPATVSGSVSWTFQRTTKGFILGNLPHQFMDRWCMKITLDHKGNKGINWVNIFGHTKNSTIWPSPYRIDTYQYAEPLTTTINFCRTQCGCPALETRTNSWGFVEPIMFTTGNPGNFMKKYNDKTSCTWSIQPTESKKRDASEVEVTRPEGIAFHWDGPFDVRAGDSLALLKFDAAGVSSTVWTATGAVAPTPILIKSSRVDLAWKTNNDGNAGTGWIFHYYAMPSIMSVNPTIGPTVDRTTAVITGAFFINSAAMGARLRFKNGTYFALPVKYLSSTQIQVVMPPSNPGTAIIEVSNDNHAGHDFWTEKTTVTYEWFDPTCSQVKTCAGCALRSNTSCSWCNNLANPSQSFCFAGAQNLCPKNDQFKTDTACCTVCGPLNKCSGGGTCLCNETCKCDDKHWAADCKCLTCPAGVGKPANYPAGFPFFNCSGHGKCGCNGKCTCDQGYRGDACECKVCEGTPTTCSGHGKCECDGSCTCEKGWTHSIPTVKICDCSTECPGNCSGHGTCKCGVCECEANWAAQPDCGCIDECPTKCNVNQTCTCNGTCACLPGFHGATCSQVSDCTNITDCTTCMATTDCGWCDDANVCENVFSAKRCGEDSFENPRGFIFVTECLVGGLESKDIESENRSSVLLAALVGTVLAAGLAMAAAAALMRAAPVLPPGFSGLGDGAGAAYQESAIYESASNVGTQ